MCCTSPCIPLALPPSAITYEWRVPQAFMKWMCCAFQSFPAKILKLMLQVCWTYCPPHADHQWLLDSLYFPVCLFVPTQVLSQVINLMDNQKNCAVNSDYKGYRGEEIFCWVGQWYIWVTKDETLLFQDLFLKNKKRKLHSTSACQAALCLHEQWAVHQSLCSPGKWLTRGWQVQAQKILHEPNNNLSKGTL